MKLSVTKKILNKFKGLNIGVILAKDIDNTISNEQIYFLLKEIEELMQLEFTRNTDNLIQPWRVVHEEMHEEPKLYKSNVGDLMRKSMKKEIPKKDSLVNLTNFIALKHIVPISALDFDKINGDIKITLKESKVLTSDKDKILIEDWSYKIKNANPTKSTKNALIIIHGLKPITQYQTKKVMADIGSSLKEFLLAKSIKVAVLNEQSLDISLK